MLRGVLLVLLLVSPSARAQQWSSTFFLDRPAVGPAGGDQSEPSVTWTGSDFFTVFADTRDGRSSDLWFRRLDASGVPLAALASPLVRAPGSQKRPVVSSGGGSVLVVWLDDTTCASEVMAQRFDPAGAALGPVRTLSTGACTDDRPSVAFDASSSRWLVVWGSHGGGKDVHGALLDATGAVVVPDFVIASAANTARQPWVMAPAGPSGTFQVAWVDDRVTFGTSNIYVASVDTAGTVSVAQQLAPSTAGQGSPCVAPWGTGSNFVVAWLESTSVRAQVLTPAGSAIGAPFVITSGPLQHLSCERVPGGDVAVVTADTRASGLGSFLRFLAADAGISAEFPAAVRVGYFDRHSPRIAFGGGLGLLVVGGNWGFVTGADVMGRALSVSGPSVQDAGTLFILGNGSTHLSHPSPAFDGTRYLVTWRDDGQSGAGSDTFGQFYEPGTGRPLLDGGVRVTTNSANLASYSSTAGAPGQGFFVSWGDDGSGGQLMGRTVDADGGMSLPRVLSDLSSYVDQHSSAWLDGSWVSAFTKSGAVRLRRTSTTNTTVMPETAYAGTNGAPDGVDSASLGSRLLATYLVRDAGLDVHGLLYDADAGVLDAGGFLIAGGAGDQQEPAVGAGASMFLAAWSADGGIYARRLATDGTWLDDPPLLLAAPPGKGAPSVGWTGYSFVVAWHAAGDVLAARVSESGQVFDAAPLGAGQDPEVERGVAIASGPTGEALLTWERFDLAWGGFRLVGRFLFDGVDAGVVDAGVVDAGVVDAGVVDAGVSDAGVADAGALDGGEVDAGTLDAGTTVDAGTSDGGSLEGVDAGEQRAPAVLAVGCGCDAGSSTAIFAWLALVWFSRGRRGA